MRYLVNKVNKAISLQSYFADVPQGSRQFLPVLVNTCTDCTTVFPATCEIPAKYLTIHELRTKAMNFVKSCTVSIRALKPFW